MKSGRTGKKSSTPKSTEPNTPAIPRSTAFPKHLPALLRAEKLVKKARKANLLDSSVGLRCRAAGRAAARPYQKKSTKAALAKELFELAAFAQAHGWSAEELLGDEIKRREQALRRQERVKTTGF